MITESQRVSGRWFSLLKEKLINGKVGIYRNSHIDTLGCCEDVILVQDDASTEMFVRTLVLQRNLEWKTTIWRTTICVIFTLNYIKSIRRERKRIWIWHMKYANEWMNYVVYWVDLKPSWSKNFLFIPLFLLYIYNWLLVISLLFIYTDLILHNKRIELYL